MAAAAAAAAASEPIAGTTGNTLHVVSLITVCLHGTVFTVYYTQLHVIIMQSCNALKKNDLLKLFFYIVMPYAIMVS